MSILEGFIYREIVMKKQSIGSFLGQLITPALYLGLFVTALSGRMPYIFYHGMKTPYLLYVLPGIIAVQMVYAFPYVAAIVYNDRRFGLLRSFFIAKGTPPMYFLGKLIAEGATLILTVSVLLVISSLLGYPPCLKNLILTALVGIPVFIFWFSFGIIVGLKIRRETTRSAVFTLLNLPLMFTAPIFYDVQRTWLAGVSLVNPLTYHVMAIRDSLLLGNINLQTIMLITLMSIGTFILAYKTLTGVSPK